MGTYIQIRDAAKAYITTHFSTLTPTVSVDVGDIDRLIQNIIKDDNTFGIYLEFGGGGRQRREQFAGREWIWRVEGVLIVRHKGDIDATEDNLANAIDLLRTLFMDNTSLSGATSFAMIDTVEPPEPLVLHDFPFYWVPFRTAYIDKQ